MSSKGQKTGIARIAEVLDRVLWPECQTTVLLETMAGKGTEVGRSFEELRAIIDQVELGDRLGVCLDTCHVYDAGYDIVNDLDGVLEQFDRVLGIGRLRAIHHRMTARTPLAATKTAMRPLATAPSVWKPWNGSSTIPSSSTCPFAWRRPMT